MQVEVTILLRDPVTTTDAPSVNKLRHFGLVVERILPRLSMVAGRIDRSKLSALQELPEVQSVEEAGSFHVGPMETRIRR
jgi:hypothetical protein